ncbi:5-(carboxyamino)imidazole ribonucleotide mutase [Marinicella gelatinilytica]|uniref:5-(carboxyamino)imidazole ribonucleotide mutase n=1 Tax=Marinicella gelatinilytica TaxID=2996017 RepID=UPI002260A3FD|nr:5-(carboxyamino)imidazole ribonucleotide mutase [Marinicella gelatinilytica]MCX7544792.1 5-(carboxyamino)imidazole ribonucleotide mutase [Marinicella gelatinilytica]
MNSQAVQVGLIMGSQSDWQTMHETAKLMDELGVNYEQEVVSAHRTPDKLMDYAAAAAGRGLKVIIAAAGGAAHLPGMVAAKTALPVIGVPIQSKTLNGIDSLLSIVQMPAGIPVMTMSIGVAGAKNAALAAASILALQDSEIAQALNSYRQQQTEKVLNNPNPAQPS